MHDNRSRTGALVRPRVTSFVAGALLAAGTMLAAPLAFAQARPPMPPGARGASAPDSVTPRPPRAPRGAMRPGIAQRRDPRAAQQPGMRRGMAPGAPGMRPGMPPRMDPRMRPRTGQGMRPGMGQPPMGPGMGRGMMPGPGMGPGMGPGPRPAMTPRGRQRGGPEVGPGARRARGPAVARGGNPAANLLRMRERLSLTDDQARRLERLAETPAPAVRGSDRLRAQEDLRAAMQGEGNVEAARGALERISRLRNEEVLAGLRARQEARRVLTDAQRRQLDGRGGDVPGRRAR